MDLFIITLTTVVVLTIAFGVVYLLRLIRWIFRLPGRLFTQMKGRVIQTSHAITHKTPSTVLYAPQHRVLMRSGHSLARSHFVIAHAWDDDDLNFHQDDWGDFDNSDDGGVNPASGLPMVGMVDTECNLYGSSGHQSDD